MKSMRIPMAALVAFAALALAACGGSTSTSSTGGGSIPETASFAPSSAAFFVSVDTDASGDQWHKAGVLLNRFPSAGKLVESFNNSNAEGRRHVGAGQAHARPRHGDRRAHGRQLVGRALHQVSEARRLAGAPEEGQPLAGQQGGRRLGGRRRHDGGRRPVHGRELERLARGRQRLQGRGGQRRRRRARARVRAGQDDHDRVREGPELAGRTGRARRHRQDRVGGRVGDGRGRRRQLRRRPQVAGFAVDRAVQPDARRDVPGEAAGLRHRGARGQDAAPGARPGIQERPELLAAAHAARAGARRDARRRRAAALQGRARRSASTATRAARSRSRSTPSSPWTTRPRRRT